jgi:hypothetical protein
MQNLWILLLSTYQTPHVCQMVGKLFWGLIDVLYIQHYDIKQLKIFQFIFLFTLLYGSPALVSRNVYFIYMMYLHVLHRFRINTDFVKENK